MAFLEQFYLSTKEPILRKMKYESHQNYVQSNLTIKINFSSNPHSHKYVIYHTINLQTHIN